METNKKDDLEQWVHSIDREVSSLVRSTAQLNARMDAQTAQLKHIEDAVDKWADRVSTPKPPIQILGAIAAIATLVVAFSVFINLRLAPSESTLAAVHENVEIHDRLSKAEHAKQGIDIAENEVLIGEIKEAHEHLDEMHHDTQARVTDLEKQQAASSAKIELIEYALESEFAHSHDDRRYR